MLSPLLAVIGVIVAFLLSLLCFYFKLLSHTTFFFLPILILIAYHTLVMQFVVKAPAEKPDWWTVGKKSVGKYIFWLCLSGSLYGIYANPPFYVHFAPHTNQLLSFFIKLYLIFGLP